MKRILLLVMLTLVTSLSYAGGHIKVTGRVTDSMGEPLLGVNVLVLGTTIGVVTDLDGRYVLDVPENGVLQFSFIGYSTVQIPVNGRSVINVGMPEDSQFLSLSVTEQNKAVEQYLDKIRVAAKTNPDFDKVDFRYDFQTRRVMMFKNGKKMTALARKVR